MVPAPPVPAPPWQGTGWAPHLRGHRGKGPAGGVPYRVPGVGAGPPALLLPAARTRSPVRSLAELAWPEALLIAAGGPSRLPGRCLSRPCAAQEGALAPSQVLARLRPSPPCRLLARWLPGCWAGQHPETKRRPGIHRGKRTESPFLQALALPPPSPASWLRGRGNSAPLLRRPICTPSTESPRSARAAGRAGRGRTAAAVPPGGDPRLWGH